MEYEIREQKVDKVNNLNNIAGIIHHTGCTHYIRPIGDQSTDCQIWICALTMAIDSGENDVRLITAQNDLMDLKTLTQAQLQEMKAIMEEKYANITKKEGDC